LQRISAGFAGHSLFSAVIGISALKRFERVRRSSFGTNGKVFRTCSNSGVDS
jgi:hypothetical protein